MCRPHFNILLPRPEHFTDLKASSCSNTSGACFEWGYEGLVSSCFNLDLQKSKKFRPQQNPEAFRPAGHGNGNDMPRTYQGT